MRDKDIELLQDVYYLLDEIAINSYMGYDNCREGELANRIADHLAEIGNPPELKESEEK